MWNTPTTCKSEKINISLNGKVISQSESYEYLSVTIDTCLIKTYKRAISKTRLLARIRHKISPCAAEMIYKVIILPQILYYSYIMFGMSNTKKLQFERIRKRVSTIINGKSQRVSLPTVSHGRNRKYIIDVFKCQNRLAIRILNQCFKKISIKKILVKITIVSASKGSH